MPSGMDLLLRTIHYLVAFAWIGGHFYWNTFVLPALTSRADWRTKANFVSSVNRYGIIRWFRMVVWLTIGTGVVLIWLEGIWNNWVLLGTVLSFFAAFWPLIPVVGISSRRDAVVKLYMEMAGSLEADLASGHPNIRELEAAFKRWTRTSAVVSYLGFVVLVSMMISAHGLAWFR